jgi:uncharacterized membrane protein
VFSRGLDLLSGARGRRRGGDGSTLRAMTTDPIDRHRRARRIGLIVVFLWFSIGGVAHFAATDIETSIVPPWVPWPRLMVLVSGALELVGAAGLVRPRTRRAAGWGLFALTIAVTPVHIWMLQRPDLFGAIPHWALVLRLPLQVALLALILWSTRLPHRGPAAAA